LGGGGLGGLGRGEGGLALLEYSRLNVSNNVSKNVLAI
jgi:hypothetical protein